MFDGNCASIYLKDCTISTTLVASKHRIHLPNIEDRHCNIEVFAFETKILLKTIQSRLAERFISSEKGQWYEARRSRDVIAIKVIKEIEDPDHGHQGHIQFAHESLFLPPPLRILSDLILCFRFLLVHHVGVDYFCMLTIVLLSGIHSHCCQTQSQSRLMWTGR